MSPKTAKPTRTPIRVFLSSPGDVQEERDLALALISRLTHAPDLNARVALDCVAWEKGAGVPLLASVTPQEAINQGLHKPSECDIVIVIFWSRMGTPLPSEYTKADGSRYFSGTEWEYEDAINASRRTGSKPYVLVYRRMEEPIIGLRDPLRADKIEQWERVESFFSAFTYEDGSIRQGYHQYHQPAEFGEQLESHLRSLIERIVNPQASAASPSLAITVAPAAPPSVIDQVVAAARDWDQHKRDAAFLWPHERLALIYPEIERLKPKLDAVTKAFIRPEQERLLDEIEDAKTLSLRRIVIGDRLAEIGDPRPGVGLNAEGLPDIVWCRVPRGTVVLDGETQIVVKKFRISKYLITYSQYKAFLDAPDGYANKVWWAAVARQQAKPGVQSHKHANRPAENVSWYDAMAFCAWLSAKLGYLVRLPLEQEWQLAATGGDPANTYPWGARWDKHRANTLESALGQTNAVGMFPQGASPLGVMDMIGTAWEWCLNLRDDYEELDPLSTEKRVVRGGGCATSKGKTKTTYRGGDKPTQRRSFISFRIVAP